LALEFTVELLMTPLKKQILWDQSAIKKGGIYIPGDQEKQFGWFDMTFIYNCSLCHKLTNLQGWFVT
jgi:hypothetical protein